uniref:HTH_48 domain-containing protein n=1 Tax=Heterorhabditis bacteriophora TaxID=37862 RepID=A0A1I7WPZ9_HETBA
MTACARIFCIVVSTNELRVIFLYESKLDNSAAHTARNITTALDDGTANERTVHRACGKPVVLVDDNVLRTLVEADPSRTLSSLAEQLGKTRMTFNDVEVMLN